MKMLCDTLPPMLVCALCLFADGLMETHGAARFILAVGIVTALCIALQGIKKALSVTMARQPNREGCRNH